MEFLEHLSAHTFFNFYSFGTLLVTIFIFLLSVFFLTLPNKSKSTLHLGLGSFFLSLFSLGYFLAAFYYHPNAAYHRWFTGGFILPAILHFGQFFLHYPENTHPRATKLVLYVQYFIAIITVSLFIFVTAKSGKKFHFTGHYWDFDVEPISKLLAIMIILYSFINFLFTGIWRAYTLEGKERRIVLLMVVAMLIAAIVPNYTNISSRDGLMERSTYLLSLVVSFVLGFFMISIIYINSTKDRTSFMAKIVSITMVTVMFILQFVSLITMKDQDADYDATKIEHIEKIISNRDYFSEVRFILKLDNKKNELKQVQYHESINLDMELIKVDLQNTSVYDTISNLPTQGFKELLVQLLNNTHPEFQGYKNSLLSFLELHKDLEDSTFKEKFFEYIGELNSLAFVITNKLSTISDQDLCNGTIKLLQSNKKAIHFTNFIQEKLQDCKWENQELEPSKLRLEINKYFRHFKPSLSRHYRKSRHLEEAQLHFVAYSYYDRFRDVVWEIGFSYLGYRAHLDKLARNQQIILISVVIGIIGLFPLFFRGSLLNPLNSLLKGVEKVNQGSLVVEVPIYVQDEIGFLAHSFNQMVVSIRTARRELQNYTDTLEEKVQERTKEVQEKMEEVQKLKEQQDGDYYLTSLLAKPLFANRNKSEVTKTDFMIKQKKQFQFRNKTAELGGDICVSGNLRLGTKEHFKRYTFALNGDAMGKSMQGAGGSLVMGVVINSIMARSARNDWVLDSTPEKWLTDLYYEVNRIFKSFNGSMVISCVAMLIDDETGDVYYFNAEHPFSVLYRDGEASFIETSLNLRKLGLDSEIPFEVKHTKLQPGDVVILGSDGRDDIDLTPDEPFKTINEDEYLFLQHVVRGRGELEGIYKSILETGALTDDFSLVRISYKESLVETPVHQDYIIEDKLSKIDQLFEESKNLAKNSKLKEAYELIRSAYEKEPTHPKVCKFYGLLAYKTKDYINAIKITRDYLKRDPLYHEFWYILGVSEKKLGNYSEAFEAAFQLYNMNHEHVMNLLNIVDLKRITGQVQEANIYLKRALDLEPKNRLALKLKELLEAKTETSLKLEEDMSEHLS